MHILATAAVVGVPLSLALIIYLWVCLRPRLDSALIWSLTLHPGLTLLLASTAVVLMEYSGAAYLQLAGRGLGVAAAGAFLVHLALFASYIRRHMRVRRNR